MGDVSHKKSSGITRIVGDNEDNIAKVSPEGEIYVNNFANVSFITAPKTVNTTASLLAVGVSNLTARKSVVVYNRGAQDIYYGDATVTDETDGIPIPKDGQAVFQVGENIDIYVVTKTGTSNIIVQEFA